METQLQKSLRLLQEYFDSDQFKLDQVVRDNERAIKLARLKRTGEYLNSLSDDQFHTLMMRLLGEHTDKLKDLWYSKGIQPMPTNKMSLLFEFVFSEDGGELLFEEDEEFQKHQTGFSDDMSKYRGYIFQMFFGQGVAHAIHKDDKKIFGGW